MKPLGVSLWLPMPPTTNNLFAGKARRFKSAGYKSWEIDAEVALLQQSYEPITGKCEAHYKYGRPDNRRRDVANYEKAVTDFLVKQGVIEDDSLINRITLEWAPVEGVQVEIWPC